MERDLEAQVMVPAHALVTVANHLKLLWHNHPAEAGERSLELAEALMKFTERAGRRDA